MYLCTRKLLDSGILQPIREAVRAAQEKKDAEF
jgi:hypothetical protein